MDQAKHIDARMSRMIVKSFSKMSCNLIMWIILHHTFAKIDFSRNIGHSITSIQDVKINKPTKLDKPTNPRYLPIHLYRITIFTYRYTLSLGSHEPTHHYCNVCIIHFEKSDLICEKTPWWFHVFGTFL